MKTSIIFISDNINLNAALSRYGRYVRKANLITIPAFTTPQLPTANIIVIQNEALINDNVCGIYAFWFDWGIKTNNRVYGFTYENTDLSNNIINWNDFLNIAFLERFSSPIDSRKIPYVDSVSGTLNAVMKPHGSESLYDLAAKLHTSFVGISDKLRKKAFSKLLGEKLANTFVKPGARIFKEFKLKEKHYHGFLSYLPESQNLFRAVRSLEDTIGKLTQVNFEDSHIISQLIELFRQAEKEIKGIYNFFRYLENHLH